MPYPLPFPTAVSGKSPLSRSLVAATAICLSLAACSDLPVSPFNPTITVPEAENELSAPYAPIRGAALYVEQYSRVRKTIEDWRHSRPSDAALLEKIATQPIAIWFGDWNPEPYDDVRRYTKAITAEGALPVFVLYNIPQRDCGQYSAGGTSGPDDYARWISEVARGIGDSRAVVLLEPDGLALMDCLSAKEQDARFQMIQNALLTLTRSGRVSVYLDAGHPGWHSAKIISKRLQRAGIGRVTGFFLNVAHFHTTEESIRYGTAVSSMVGGKHFVIDTGRNGLGPTASSEWCNPAGRALGTRPTTQTGHPLVDAFLWIKTPGESDGECNGGPTAGRWWPEYALGLAERATW